MRKACFLIGATVLFLASIPGTASAVSIGLTGDTVNGTMHYDGFAQNFFALAQGGTGDTAVVGGGIEFSTAEFNYPVRANLGAFDLFIIHDNNVGAGVVNGFTVDLTDLDFDTGLITGVNLLSNGFTTLTYSFTGDSIHIDVDPYGHPDVAVTAHLEFVTGAAAVPEPMSLTLLGSGLAGLAIRRRRRTA